MSLTYSWRRSIRGIVKMSDKRSIEQEMCMVWVWGKLKDHLGEMLDAYKDDESIIEAGDKACEEIERQIENIKSKDQKRIISARLEDLEQSVQGEDE